MYWSNQEVDHTIYPACCPGCNALKVARFRLGDRARLLPLVRLGPRQQLPFVGGRAERLGGAEVEHGVKRKASPRFAHTDAL
jgi:hypothetical protein